MTQQLKNSPAAADGDVGLSGSCKPQPPWRLRSWRRPRGSRCRCRGLWKEHFISTGWTRLLYNPTQPAGTTQKFAVDQLWVFSSFRHHVSDGWFTLNSNTYRKQSVHCEIWVRFVPIISDFALSVGSHDKDPLWGDPLLPSGLIWFPFARVRPRVRAG